MVVSDLEWNKDCEPKSDVVPHVLTDGASDGIGDNETDTVPHKLTDGDADDDVEADGAIEPPLVPVSDKVIANDSVVEIVGDKEGVADTVCEKDRELTGDMVWLIEPVSHTLAVDRSVDSGVPDTDSDNPFDIVPDEENEFNMD